MPEKVDLLLNTGSRTARQQKIVILERLEANGFVVDVVHEVSRRQPLEVAVSKVIRRKPKLLIVGGGDGTISSVMDRLVKMNTEIGLIPLGTTNNFARSLGIPLGIDDAIKRIRLKKARTVDLGRINRDFFTNVAGIGLSAQIAAHVTSSQKKRWGRLAYAIVGVKQLLVHKPFYVTLEDPDGELSITMETRQVIIANGRYHAGREISADAKIDNGQLIIFALGGRSLLSFMKHMFDFYLGTRKSVAHASYFVGRKVKVTTSTAQLIELDGEVKQKTPARVNTEIATIRVRG